MGKRKSAIGVEIPVQRSHRHQQGCTCSAHRGTLCSGEGSLHAGHVLLANPGWDDAAVRSPRKWSVTFSCPLSMSLKLLLPFLLLHLSSALLSEVTRSERPRATINSEHWEAGSKHLSTPTLSVSEHAWWGGAPKSQHPCLLSHIPFSSLPGHPGNTFFRHNLSAGQPE